MTDCILVTIMYVHMQYFCNPICYGLPELEAWILVNYLLCLFVCLYLFKIQLWKILNCFLYWIDLVIWFSQEVGFSDVIFTDISKGILISLYTQTQCNPVKEVQVVVI